MPALGRSGFTRYSKSPFFNSQHLDCSVQQQTSRRPHNHRFGPGRNRIAEALLPPRALHSAARQIASPAASIPTIVGHSDGRTVSGNSKVVRSGCAKWKFARLMIGGHRNNGKSVRNEVMRAPSIHDLRRAAALGTSPSVLRVNRIACATERRCELATHLCRGLPRRDLVSPTALILSGRTMRLPHSC